MVDNEGLPALLHTRLSDAHGSAAAERNGYYYLPVWQLAGRSCYGLTSPADMMLTRLKGQVAMGAPRGTSTPTRGLNAD